MVRPTTDSVANETPYASTGLATDFLIDQVRSCVTLTEEEHFLNEAIAALPGTLVSSASPSPEDVFDGLMMQRATLKRDQQLAEWICC